MAGTIFTDDQLDAINTIDKSVLVSAAAGSGKTAVLVERIINIIVQGRADVDHMAVVTFTNAAAAEMKLKLVKAIKKAVIEAGGSDSNRAGKLQSQLNKMYKSYISTFHKFAMNIIKEFFYLTDLEPGFSICDESRIQIMQMEAAEELLDMGFEDDSFIEGLSFRDFLDRYSSEKGEDKLVEEIISSYAKLRSMPNYFKWTLEKAEELNYPKDGGYIKTPVYRELAKTIRDEIKICYENAAKLRELLLSHQLTKTEEKIDDEVTAIEKAANLLLETGEDVTDHNNLKKALDEIFKMSFGRLQNGAGEKKQYDEIRDDVKPLRDDYKSRINYIRDRLIFDDLDTVFEEMAATYKYTVYFINMLQMFEKFYDMKKREQGVVDFGDIEHIAAKILENEQAAETLRKRFDFIFIDEYQDTSYIQEYIIGKIARSDNMFKVGDIKQSIYRFRQAEPEIFAETYRLYDREEYQKAKVINLNKNFRSNSATIDYINHVFRDLMPNYDLKAALNCGRNDIDNCDSCKEYDFKPEVHVLIDPGESNNDNDEPEEALSFNEEGENMSKNEREAAYIAQLVEELIGKQFYDSKNGVVRAVEPRDIVILLRSMSGFKGEVYYKALKERNIEAYVNDDDGYFDTVEIAVAMALLRVIDNVRQDIPLIAVLRSEIFGYTPEELGEIRAFSNENKDDRKQGRSYYEALLYYAEHGALASLKDKIANTISSLKEWRDCGLMMPLDDYVWYLLSKSKYYMYAGAMYGGNQRQANLRTLVEKATKFKNSNIASLNSYIRYLEILRKKQVKTGQPLLVSQEDNLVRIMTIHRSKGLEFPFVIIGAMSGKRNIYKNDGICAFDSKEGIGLTYVNKEKKYKRNTLKQLQIKNAIDEAEYQEELRVLYVAMTRAREKLVLVGSPGKDDAFIQKDDRSSNNYFKMMGRLCDTDGRLNDYFVFDTCNMRRLLVKPDYNTYLVTSKLPSGVTDTDEYKEVKRRLDYKYAFSDDLKIKAKYSVSELRREIIEKERKTGNSLINVIAKNRGTGKLPKTASSTVNAAARGTAYHRIMEFVDFTRCLDDDDNCDKNYITEKVEYLVEQNAIEERVYKTMDMNNIYKFFNSDLGKRACRAAKNNRLEKETPFTLKTTKNGKNILVQGIIDCYFGDEKGTVLIDYKSSYINASDMENEARRIKHEYEEQIRIYKQAIELGRKTEVNEAYLYLLETGTKVDML